MPFALTEQSAIAYLADRGMIAEASTRSAKAQALGGGVSNIVVRVSVPGESADLVLKQSLPRLRVQQEWLADRERVHREAASLRYLCGVLPNGALPQVVFDDPSNYLFVMTAAPQEGINWKDALLGGDVNEAVAAKVGMLLGTMHRCSAVHEDDIPAELREFADRHCFVQLRIDPYHRATAAVHPDLADAIESEAQQMLNRRHALVHGDYSPKNIIVAGAGASAEVFLLDFEVVHLGNPIFDLAFMLNHLTMKAIHRPEWAGLYNAAARAFWSAYLATEGPGAEAGNLERQTVRQLGVLLLARMDGKSPAEYITDAGQKREARSIARAILTGEISTIAELHQTLMTLSGAS